MAQDELDVVIGQVQERVVELQANANELREVCTLVQRVVAAMPRQVVTPKDVSAVIDAPPVKPHKPHKPPKGKVTL